jgi:surface antigen
MIREYQTQITVGGRLVDAYGDACLMPDGSWERGPPKVVPDY